jgi:Triose-phosphate Transporter family.
MSPPTLTQSARSPSARLPPLAARRPQRLQDATIIFGSRMLRIAMLTRDVHTLSSLRHDGALPASEWAVFCLTAELSGARVYEQYFFLQRTSATSLAVSNIAILALTSEVSIAFFHTPPTPLLFGGVTLTIAATTLYTWLRLTASPLRGHGVDDGKRLGKRSGAGRRPET